VFSYPEWRPAKTRVGSSSTQNSASSADLCPQGRGRFRAYFGYPSSSGYRLNGKESLSLFLSESAKVAPPFGELYAKASDIGPLASFDGGDFWVEHP
jgi:hypothetical protein